MDSRRQQQFPPILQAGGHPPRQHLPLPPPPHMTMGPRPSSFSSGPSPPLSGHKRSSGALYNRPSDGPTFTKLFVGSLPRNISEEQVRELFSDFGDVVEVIFLKDKKTGLSQGCCFIKYSSVADAERAIRALDNQRTLKGASEPLQVKFADGERDNSGPFEYKLFVGSVSRQATEQDIEEIFAPYGRVENVYVIRNEHKQSRGCAFVSFPEKEMAFSAISALDGVYRMAGCHQPLIVRFADPKRPRSGEGRMGSNYSPHSHQGGGGPRGSGGGQPMRTQSPGYGWRQGGGPSGMGLLPQTGILPLGARGPIHSRGGPLEGPSPTLDGRAGVGGGPASSVISGQVGFSSTSGQLSQQQGLRDSPLHRPVQAFGSQLSLHQQAMQLNIPHSTQLQPVQGIPITQPSEKRGQQMVPTGQFSSAQLTAHSYGATPVSLPQSQQQFVPSMQQPMSGLPTQQFPPQAIHQQTPQQSQQTLMMPLQQGQQQGLALQSLQPQLQQPMVAKEQGLPSQLQQQTVVKDAVQQSYLQPSLVTTQQPVAVGTMQPSWSVPVQQHAVAPVIPPALAVSTTSAPVLLTCDWTEHTSPEGHKYYYNSSTGESRWEKPDEYAAYEKQKLQQQQQQQQQPHHPQQSEPPLQAQQHVQQLQPQLLSQQYQIAGQHSQPSLLQSYAQNMQPLQQHQLPMQQGQHHPIQLQQPQLQQLQQQQQQQPPPAQPALLQQPQPQASPAVSSAPYAQSTSGAVYQSSQAYAHMQPAVHQQLAPSQQAPSANGTTDLTRGAQWNAAVQQTLPNQEWMWKNKPMGS